MESSVKFFADASEDKACCSSYVGPFLHENLSWRLSEARRKVTCTQSQLVARIEDATGEIYDL